MNTIRLTNVSKLIKGKVILDNISIEIPRGTVNGFYGRNGSGKTMLFKAISGLILVNGEINIFGDIIGKDISFPKELGLVIDNVELWPHLSGFENLKQLSMIKRKITSQDIIITLNRVGLVDPLIYAKYRTYSLGTKQKAAIAQAIMEKQQLIILDEPTNSLDEQSIEALKKILIEEKERGATILIASHNQDDIKILCDNIYVLETGRCKKVNEL